MKSTIALIALIIILVVASGALGTALTSSKTITQSQTITQTTTATSASTIIHNFTRTQNVTTTSTKTTSITATSTESSCSCVQISEVEIQINGSDYLAITTPLLPAGIEGFSIGTTLTVVLLLQNAPPPPYLTSIYSATPITQGFVVLQSKVIIGSQANSTSITSCQTISSGSITGTACATIPLQSWYLGAPYNGFFSSYFESLPQQIPQNYFAAIFVTVQLPANSYNGPLLLQLT